MTRDQLWIGINRLCQQYGFTTEHTDNLIDNLIDSIEADEEEISEARGAQRP